MSQTNTNRPGRSLRAPGPDTRAIKQAALLVTLSLTLAGALRWAMDISNANTHQVSTGLFRLQASFDAGEAGRTQRRTKPTKQAAPTRKAVARLPRTLAPSVAPVEVETEARSER